MNYIRQSQIFPKKILNIIFKIISMSQEDASGRRRTEVEIETASQVHFSKKNIIALNVEK